MADNALSYPVTPYLINQQCTFHLGVVKDVKDPEGRGRVRVECPGLLGKGKKNWTPWAEVFANPIGSNNSGDGDEGIWWPLQHGQIVGVGYLTGDPFAYFVIPGPPCQEKPEAGTQLTPEEAKKIGGKEKPRERTRLNIVKTESGHTLFFDSRGKKEKMFLVDWTGSGLFVSAPGKKQDEEEKEGEESKPRKGERRGTKLVVTGTAKKPSEILRDGSMLMGLLDLIGQGIIQFATDGRGMVAVFATKGPGQIGPSLVLDSQKDNAYVTAGDVQIQILGEKGHIRVTRQIVKEAAKKVPVEDAIQAMLAGLGAEFKELSE